MTQPKERQDGSGYGLRDEFLTMRLINSMRKQKLGGVSAFDS